MHENEKNVSNYFNLNFRTLIRQSTTCTGPALSATLSARPSWSPWFPWSSRTSSVPPSSRTSSAGAPSHLRGCTTQKCRRHPPCQANSRPFDNFWKPLWQPTWRRPTPGWAAFLLDTTPSSLTSCWRRETPSWWLTTAPCSSLSSSRTWSWPTRERRNLFASLKKDLDESDFDPSP